MTVCGEVFFKSYLWAVAEALYPPCFLAFTDFR